MKGLEPSHIPALVPKTSVSTIPPHRYVCRISLNLRWVYLPPCSLMVLRFFCDSGGTRTHDFRIKSAKLYQLSYEIIGRGGRTRTCESLGPKPSGLPTFPHPVIVTLEGFEPPLAGPKPAVLPLDERAICGIQYVKELSNKKPLTEFYFS
jgi:hypothetical protein